MRLLACALAGGTVALAMSLALRSWGRPSRPNYRGVRLPVVLGIAWTAGTLMVVPVVLASAASFGAGARRLALGVLAAVPLLFLAGLYDDLRPERTHGVLAQLGLLARGRVSPGVVKLLAALAAAAVAIVLSGGWTTLRLALGIPVIAGAANMWNLLDVRPGRSLKFFVPAALLLAFLARGSGYPALAAAALGAAAAVLPFDLREKAMLGDGGANVLGFVVGLGLYRAFGPPALAALLAAILVVHVLSETVTLSRLIQAAPPLRWFDLLGRVRRPEGEPLATTPQAGDPSLAPNPLIP